MRIYRLNNEEREIVILNEDNFEKVDLCDCYDRYGQKHGCCNAGCYTLENSEGCAKDYLLSDIEEKFKVDVEIDNSENDEIYEVCEIDGEDVYEWQEDMKDLNGEENKLALVKKINEFIREWISENTSHTEVTAWNFWNGNNFQSLILNNEFDESDLEEVDDKLDEQILKEFEDCEWSDWSHGYRRAETENFYFGQSQFASDYTIARVEMK